MKKSFFKSYNHLFILVWIIIVSLCWLQFFNHAPAWVAGLLTIAIFTPTILIACILDHILLPKAIREKRMGRFILQFLLSSLVLAFIYALVFKGFYEFEKMGMYTTSGPQLYTNSFFMEFVSSIPTTVLVNLGFCGLRFYYEHTQLHEAHLKSQLQTLRQQINPHFMFNVLNHIHILMQKDTALASLLLVKYSSILRYQLYTEKNEPVPLSREVRFLKDVIEVEKIRWGNELHVNASWTVENEKKRIHPFLLITFVENAFKHVSRSISESGYIDIMLEQKDDSLCLHVENSRSLQQPQQKKASGVGLRNIRAYLDMLYPEKHRLTIGHTEQTYTTQLIITI